MASGAAEDRIVRGIRMAGRAYAIGTSMTCREPRVIECRSGPGGSGVAGLAGRRETCRGVIRIRRALVFR